MPQLRTCLIVCAIAAHLVGAAHATDFPAVNNRWIRPETTSFTLYSNTSKRICNERGSCSGAILRSPAFAEAYVGYGESIVYGGGDFKPAYDHEPPARDRPFDLRPGGKEDLGGTVADEG
jgi:hypothetical protein